MDGTGKRLPSAPLPKSLSTTGARAAAREMRESRGKLKRTVTPRSGMADCDLCGRAEVTLVPVPVPSDLSAYRETGTWAGLCTRCVELCRSGSGGETLAGRCGLCRRTVAGLASISLERPSLSGPKSFTVALCPECIEGCKGAAAPEIARH